MTPAPTNLLLRRLRDLAGGLPAGLPDRDLLRCFLEGGSAAAFAALVERHGPMVLGVCRTVLRHEQDAEDAFQATFLVLARSARSIRRRDSLGSWLHGVAHRVACKARAAGARRQAVEAQAVHRPVASADDLTWAEVRAILHAELAALPECYREPLILCYLQGLTRDQAARRLGWNATTVKGRLQRGRELLRRRLERRGLGLGATLGAALLTGQVLATPVPARLLTAAVRSVLPLAGDVLPAGADALARAVLGPLVPARSWLIAGLLLVAALAGGAVLSMRQPASSGPEPHAQQPAAARQAPTHDRFGDPLPDGAVARLGTVRFNHGDGLNALRFTPDGKRIISEGRGFLCLWDAVSGKELGRFATAEASWDDQTALTPDGKTLISLHQEFPSDRLRVWDLARGKEVRSVPLPVRRREQSIYRRNALSRDGRLCAIHMPREICVLEVATLRELYRLPDKADLVRTVIFAGPDRLVTVEKNHRISVREARTGNVVRQFTHGSRTYLLTASADGSRLATLERQTRPFRLGNGRLVQLHDRDVIRVWDLTTGAQRHALKARPKGWHINLRFSPDGKLLCAASMREDGQELYVLTVWDTATGQRVRELAGACGRAIAISPDGKRLAESDEGKFHLWDVQTGRRLFDDASRRAQTQTVYLSPGGERVSTFGHATLSAWDGTTGRHLGAFDLPPYHFSDPANSHFFSPDGRYAVSFHENHGQLEVLVWDVAVRRRLHTLRPPGATMPVTTAVENVTRVFGPLYVTCACSPAAPLLATRQAGKENVIRLWDLRTGKEIRSFKDTQAGWPGTLFFTADGKTLFVAGQRLVAFDVASGRERFSRRLRLPRPGNTGGFVVVGGGKAEEPLRWRALAVSPDGTTVACILTGGGFDTRPVADRLVLCEVSTGEVIQRWGDSGKTSPWWEQLAFSRDGRLLASSDRWAVHVWEVATGKEVRIFRSHRGEIRSLVFSANGRRLASASSDSTVLLWDLPLALGARPSAREAGEKEVAALWIDLAGADAARAYAAVWKLAATPASVPLLRRHLRPDTDAQQKEVRQWLQDLDSRSFAVRDRAFRRLKSLGQAAGPALRLALAKTRSLEVQRRLQRLLENLRHRPMSGEPLRTLRALVVLEQAATSEARRLLRELAAGAAGGWLTQEAKAVCERLALRPNQ
jgi:RNA polymerase sigma factor (sigma-70 family)